MTASPILPPDIALQQAISHHQAGRLQEAEQLYRAILKTLPYQPDANHNLGVLAGQAGQHAAGLPFLKAALAINPAQEQYSLSYAEALLAAGQAKDALNIIQAAMQRGLNTPALQSLRQKAEAVVLNSANGEMPASAENSQLAALQRAAALQPDNGEAHFHLGNALKALGQLAGAVMSYQRALELRPDFTAAYHKMGIALHALGQVAGAVACYRQALERDPDFAAAHNDLGNALQDLGQLDGAATSYRRAIELKPDFAAAHYNLGIVLKGLGQIDGAVASYRRALEIKPNFVKALNNLGVAMQGLGQTGNAVVSYRRALELKPDYAEAHSNLLFCLSHSDAMDARALFAEHCRFAGQFEAPLRANWPQHTHSREPERHLQVGFVSADLRNHAVAHFIEPVLAHLAAYPQLSLHAYSNHTIEDSVTQRLRGHFSHWHAIGGLSDAALAQKIRMDNIDILIDLSGHTAKNRLLTFARKPAPIQITLIGYPNTTGLQAMDYVLMDRFNAPYGAYEHFYVEKLARVPSSRTFLPAEDAPPVNNLPALSTGSVTFGSFNSPGKLGDGVIELWSEVLRAVPGSRLLLGNAGEGSLRGNLLERFARCGVAADRLIFQPRMEMTAYLALHHQVDFILDTFPYTGGTTTNHALWMGVPVLTMSGPSAMQCQCAGALGRVGLSDWVARDAEDFVRRAVDWAGRLDELAGLRAGMRDRLQASPLRQPETVARGLDAAFRSMWRRWCEGLPAESFEVERESLGVDFPVETIRVENQQNHTSPKTAGQA